VIFFAITQLLSLAATGRFQVRGPDFRRLAAAVTSHARAANSE
jgi:hypothetical protein